MSILNTIRRKLGLCEHDFQRKFIILDRPYTYTECSKCGKVKRVKD